MELSGIFVYPVKSMAGISLNESKLEASGLMHDRKWMLVDKNGRFISQREIPQLAKFTMTIYSDHLRIVWGKEYIDVPFESSFYRDQKKVEVWDDQMSALIAEDAINSWFSLRLNFPCQLVYQSKHTERFTSPKHGNSSELSFVDAYPFLMISEESLYFLNQKLSQPMEMNRFRPNLIIKGGTPHIEDEFPYFKIGEVIFNAVKPCARCQIVTIDQSHLTQGVEPLKTLATYRKVGNKVMFGQNLIMESKPDFILKTGDKIIASDKKIQDN